VGEITQVSPYGEKAISQYVKKNLRHTQRTEWKCPTISQLRDLESDG
jgi:hypothetical protein